MSAPVASLLVNSEMPRQTKYPSPTLVSMKTVIPREAPFAVMMPAIVPCCGTKFAPPDGPSMGHVLRSGRPLPMPTMDRRGSIWGHDAGE